MIGFFPFPYPVVTPLGEGYAIYVVSQPMWENDAWAVQLDDGRILHFSTNQLRGVANGSYHINPPKPDAALTAPSSSALDLGQPPFAPNAPKPKPTTHLSVRGGEAKCGPRSPRHSTQVTSATTGVTGPRCARCGAVPGAAPTRPPEHYAPAYWFDRAAGVALEPLRAVCGETAGAHASIGSDPTHTTCPDCCRITSMREWQERPPSDASFSRTEAMYHPGSSPVMHMARDPLAVHAYDGGCGRVGLRAGMQEPEKVSCFDCCALGNGWRRADAAGLVHCKSATRPGSTVCGIDRIDEKLVLITFNQALVSCAGCR